jgi:ribonuclease HII
VKKQGEQPDLWRYERQAHGEGHTIIAGLDEVGRGPLAGPVVSACVVLPPDFALEGIGDSKALTERQRERAEARIRREALAIGLGLVDAPTIDSINILQAARQAMREAWHALTPFLSPTLALIDGLPVPNFPCPNQRAIVKGDSLSASIAAASIVAKVYRDNLLCVWDSDYPEYGFAGHKGYGSAKHLEALQKHGPCPLHRRSFAPVAAVCTQTRTDAPHAPEP